MLLAKKSSEILSKHKGYFYILESLVLNWYIFVALTNRKLLLPLKCKLKQNFLLDLQNLI